MPKKPKATKARKTAHRPVKRFRGRPTVEVLTPELTARMAGHLRGTITINDACALEGISKQSHYRWLDEGLIPPGEKDHKPAAWTYRLEIEAALAEYKSSVLKSMERTGRNGNWQALAWILERRFPDEFGRKDKMALVGGFAHKPGEADEPVRLLEVVLTDKRGKPPAEDEDGAAGSRVS